MDTLTSREAGGGFLSYSLTPGNDAAVLISKSVHAVSMSVIPDASSSAKFQISISSPDKVAAGTANWVDWSNGAVSASTLDVINAPISAIKAVCVSGSAVFELAV